MIERYYYDEEHPFVKCFDNLADTLKKYQDVLKEEEILVNNKSLDKIGDEYHEKVEAIVKEKIQLVETYAEQVENARDLIEDYPEVVKADKNLRFEQARVHDR